jgi:hypothetical protein
VATKEASSSPLHHTENPKCFTARASGRVRKDVLNCVCAIVGIASILGLWAALRSRTTVGPLYAAGWLIAFAMLQIGAFWLSLSPYIATPLLKARLLKRLRRRRSPNPGVAAAV